MVYDAKASYAGKSWIWDIAIDKVWILTTFYAQLIQQFPFAKKYKRKP